jgi:hypothetical protein
MNCDAEIHRRTRARRHDGRVVEIRPCGVTVSGSWMVIRSRYPAPGAGSPVRTCIWINSPTARMRRLPRWSMSSG